MYVNNMNYLYTYVTHNDRYFNSLVDSSKKQNIDIVIRGMGHKWEGYVQRHRELLNFLKTLDKNDIVINVDGFDTIVLCPLEEITRKFKGLNCDLLFSMTSKNANAFQKYIQWKLGFYGIKANAGMFMGYTFKLQEFIEKLLNTGEYNDQIVLNQMPFGNDTRIKIDTDQKVFCNISTTNGLHIQNGKLYYENKQPCLLSAPGCVDLRPWLRRLKINESQFTCNTSQRLKEYYHYFIIEIILLLLVFYIVLRRTLKR